MHHPLAGTERRIGVGFRLVEKITGYRTAQANVIDEFRRDLAQKTRRLRIEFRAVHTPVPGVTQGQFFTRPGNAHVAKPPLLFQLRRVTGTALMGEQPLFHTDQVNPVELQPLGGMQGHQVDCVGPGISLGVAGIQRRLGQECRQGVHLAVHVLIHLELPGGADQFLQVLNPGKSPLSLFLAVVLDQPAGADGDVHGFIRFLTPDGLCGLLDQPEKPLQRGQGAGRQKLVRHQRAGSLPQRYVFPPGPAADFFQAALADSPGRRVDDTLERGIIIPVGGKSQVSQGILDFHAFVKPHPAEHAIGHLGLHQRFLQHPRGGADPVQDGVVLVVEVIQPGRADPFHHKTGFVMFVVGRVQFQFFACPAFRPQVFSKPGPVVCDQGIGGIQNVGG